MLPPRPLAAGVLAALAAATATAAASASQLIDRGASDVRLRIAADGSALLSYREAGQPRLVRAWGARNALVPSTARPQVRLSLQYFTGGWARSRERMLAVEASCRPYSGPRLHWLVAACTAPDGSYWAAQSWPRGLPNFGVPPTPAQAARELRLSHWSGAVASLYANVDWSYGGRFDDLYGTVTYGGSPVYGFKATRFGVPLDGYGRNVYLDTYNSAYGPGWRRENGFLTQKPTGAFCYSFFTNALGISGRGELYRATVVGPGVSPDVFWQGRAPGPYDAALDGTRNAEMRRLGAPRDCWAH